MLIRLKAIFFYLMVFTAIAEALTIHQYPIITEHRRALTRQYDHDHYGIETETLTNPQVIVVHATESLSLASTLKMFKSDELEPGRAYLHKFSELNVGVHFLVGRNGDIYALLPLDVIGRHTIGLNYTAIGIENIGLSGHLTNQQLAANAALIADLLSKKPTVRYLIGHSEYVNPKLPHYKLYKELIPGYHPTEKSDPGDDFMRSLRATLHSQGVDLEK
jgi:N-acetylmuramoyl-L-alanine amidase